MKRFYTIPRGVYCNCLHLIYKNHWKIGAVVVTVNRALVDACFGRPWIMDEMRPIGEREKAEVKELDGRKCSWGLWERWAARAAGSPRGCAFRAVWLQTNDAWWRQKEESDRVIYSIL